MIQFTADVTTIRNTLCWYRILSLMLGEAFSKIYKCLKIFQSHLARMGQRSPPGSLELLQGLFRVPW